MSQAELVDRLAAFPTLATIPREELEWLVTRGGVEAYEAGAPVLFRGDPIDRMWIVLSGYVAVHRDLGAGPRRVLEWHAGDVTGLLPYSRATVSTVDVQLDEATTLLSVHESHLPAMIQECPAFTTHVVHLMLDRARTFKTNDLQEEKAISLGKLAAGLAHELNNPASATLRTAELLPTVLDDADDAVGSLSRVSLDADQSEALEELVRACREEPPGRPPIEQMDHEDRIADWLEAHGTDPALAGTLADTALDGACLDRAASRLPGEALDAALRWAAARRALGTLASDAGAAAKRIHDMVEAMKRFTYMDNLSAPESVDVEEGLRDTLQVLSSRVREKDARICVDIDPGLPRVRASGSDLNQVWMGLIDNALDAIPEGGQVEVTARDEGGRIVVRVIDGGPGIPDEVMPRIFDPFFTTKAPGQGTGLGLEIARRLLRRSRGDVSVESRPGRTEFRVSLEAEG